MINLGGYNFEGPYPNTINIEDRPGIYAVLCNHNVVLYIGTSGEGMYPDSQGLKRRLNKHDRKSDWEGHCKSGRLTYAVMYIENQNQRLNIEKDLHIKYHSLFSTAL